MSDIAVLMSKVYVTQANKHECLKVYHMKQDIPPSQDLVVP